MRAILTTVAFAAAAFAAPVPKEHRKPRPDAERFVGAWEIVEATAGGKPYAKAVWTFDADLKMTSRPIGGQGQGPGPQWTIQLDPTQSPKHIDISHLKGIYEFDRAELKIAYTLTERPTSFDPQNGLYFNRLRRIGAEKK